MEASLATVSDEREKKRRASAKSTLKEHENPITCTVVERPNDVRFELSLDPQLASEEIGQLISLKEPSSLLKLFNAWSRDQQLACLRGLHIQASRFSKVVETAFSLKKLFAAVQDASSQGSLDAKLQRTGVSVASLLNCERATILIADHASGDLWTILPPSASSSGAEASGAEQKVNSRGVEIRLPLGSGVPGFVMRTSRPVRVLSGFKSRHYHSLVDDPLARIPKIENYEEIQEALLHQEQQTRTGKNGSKGDGGGGDVFDSSQSGTSHGNRTNTAHNPFAGDGALLCVAIRENARSTPLGVIYCTNKKPSIELVKASDTSGVVVPSSTGFSDQDETLLSALSSLIAPPLRIAAAATTSEAQQYQLLRTVELSLSLAEHSSSEKLVLAVESLVPRCVIGCRAARLFLVDVLKPGYYRTFLEQKLFSGPVGLGLAGLCIQKRGARMNMLNATRTELSRHAEFVDLSPAEGLIILPIFESAIGQEDDEDLMTSERNQKDDNNGSDRGEATGRWVVSTDGSILQRRLLGVLEVSSASRGKSRGSRVEGVGGTATMDIQVLENLCRAISLAIKTTNRREFKLAKGVINALATTSNLERKNSSPNRGFLLSALRRGESSPNLSEIPQEMHEKKVEPPSENLKSLKGVFTGRLLFDGKTSFENEDTSEINTDANIPADVNYKQVFLNQSSLFNKNSDNIQHSDLHSLLKDSEKEISHMTHEEDQMDKNSVDREEITLQEDRYSSSANNNSKESVTQSNIQSSQSNISFVEHSDNPNKYSDDFENSN